MISLKTDPKDLKTAVQAAVAVLRRGGVIAYPTETTYGLGCDPWSRKAVGRILEIKGRDRNKPMLLVAGDVGQVLRLVEARQASPVRRIMEKNWPGPLTLVLPIRRGGVTPPLPKMIAPRGEIGIRVSSAEFVREVCRAFGRPIVSTSANLSGEQDCRSGRAVKGIFGGSRGTARRAPTIPDLLIDAGALPRRQPSTVARVKADGTVEILRQGAVRIGSLDAIRGQA